MNWRGETWFRGALRVVLAETMLGGNQCMESNNGEKSRWKSNNNMTLRAVVRAYVGLKVGWGA